MEKREILEIKVAEYKKKSFEELEALVDKVECLTEEFDGKSYNFEVHVIRGEAGRVRVMMDCARNNIFTGWFGVARYFAMSPDGQTHEDEAW